MKASPLAFASVFLLAPLAHAQSLLVDINQTPSPLVNPDSDPSWFARAGGYVFFEATVEGSGAELWKTDGTAGGTELVADIRPGALGSEPSFFVPFGSGVLFRAQTDEHGIELHFSDGSAAGTYLVKDVAPGTGHGFPGSIATLGSFAYFVADDGTGNQLWRTDGTEAGTIAVSAFPGEVSSLNKAGSTLFMTVDAFPGPGVDLWTSDGTTHTFVEQLANTDEVLVMSWPEALGDKLVFRSTNASIGGELWISDGTAAGTFPVDIYPGASGSTPYYMQTVGDLCFFNAYGPAQGRELWVTDGTLAGTELVIDLGTQGGTSGSNPTFVGVLGDELLFDAWVTATGGRELWASDGTAAGTRLVSDMTPGGGSILYGGSEELNGEVYYMGGSSFDIELWKTDGTDAGTVRVADIFPGLAGSQENSPFTPVVLGNQVIFNARDGLIGAEPWRSDGTAAGTVAIADLAVPDDSAGSGPELLARGPDIAFYSADDGVGGRELWKTDGTAAGTSMVTEINPTGGSFGFLAEFYAKAFQGGVVFPAIDGGQNEELWVSDGTAAGTYELELVPGPTGSFPRDIAVDGDRFFVTATTATLGRELFVSDGTVAGSALVKEINPGADTSDPRDLFVHDGKCYFAAYTAAMGYELYVSDGTAAGTGLVKDISPTNSGLVLDPRFNSFDGEVIFLAFEPGFGTELWRTDGTEAGTTRITDTSAFGGVDVEEYAILDEDTILLRVEQPVGGFFTIYQLWVTDGTPGGTTRLEIPDFHGLPSSNTLAAVGNGLGVFAEDLDDGYGLWSTDGTLAGTEQIATFEGSAPTEFINLGDGKLTFRVFDPVIATELWITDGTAAGTMPLVDIAPGGFSASPEEIARVGTKVVVAATDGFVGTELFAFDFTVTEDWVAEPIGSGCAGTGGLVPAISIDGTPVASGSFDVALTDALPSTAAFLAYSTGAAWIDLGDCNLYLAPPFFLLPTVVDPVGTASIPVSPTPAMVGFKVDFQYLVVDPGGAYLSLLSATGAVEVVVGP